MLFNNCLEIYKSDLLDEVIMIKDVVDCKCENKNMMKTISKNSLNRSSDIILKITICGPRGSNRSNLNKEFILKYNQYEPELHNLEKAMEWSKTITELSKTISNNTKHARKNIHIAISP